MTINAPIKMVSIDKLVMSPHNKRGDVNSKDVASIVKQLKGGGRINQPPLGRLHPTKKGYIELCYGKRRLNAVRMAGLKTMPVMIREMSDAESLKATVTENLDQADLTPLEEAECIKAMLDAGGTFDSVAADLGRASTFVARRTQLTHLSARWKKALLSPESERNRLPQLSVGHLEVIARLLEKAQDSVIDPLNRELGYERPTVKELAARLDPNMELLHFMPWELDDEALLPKAGPCSGCPKRTGAHPLLWDDEIDADGGKVRKDDRCLDPACRAAKQTAYLVRQEAEFRRKHHDLILLELSRMTSISAANKEVFGSKVMLTRSCIPAKKSNPDAQPTMFINGPSAGKLMYIKKEGISKPVTKSQKTPSVPADKTIPIPLAERRKKLQRRRAVHVVTAVSIALRRRTTDELAKLWPDDKGGADLSSLLLTFGTSGNRPSIFENYGKKAAWRAYDLNQQKQRSAVFGELLHSVLVVCLRRLANPVGEFAWRQVVEAKRLCEVLKIDFTPFEQRAEREIPKPKNWQNLMADGTPKTLKKKTLIANKAPAAKAPGKKKAVGKKVRKST